MSRFFGSVLGLALLILSPVMAEAAEKVYLVRHAEKELNDSRDPALTADGHARAEHIARLLVPMGVTAVFSSDYIRTRDTAQPIADALETDIQLYDPREQDAFAETLRATEGVILVVGHSNTVPALVNILAGTEYENLVEATEYSSLFIVNMGDSVETTSASKICMGEVSVERPQPE